MAQVLPRLLVGKMRGQLKLKQGSKLNGIVAEEAPCAIWKKHQVKKKIKKKPNKGICKGVCLYISLQIFPVQSWQAEFSLKQLDYLGGETCQRLRASAPYQSGWPL